MRRTHRKSGRSSARALAVHHDRTSNYAASTATRKIPPFFIPSAIINLEAGQVSIRFGAMGPNLATRTACWRGPPGRRVVRDHSSRVDADYG